MNELELETPKAKAKPRAPRMITIVSKCGNGSMTLQEGRRELEDLIDGGWKVKKGK